MITLLCYLRVWTLGEREEVLHLLTLYLFTLSSQSLNCSFLFSFSSQVHRLMDWSMLFSTNQALRWEATLSSSCVVQVCDLLAFPILTQSPGKVIFRPSHASAEDRSLSGIPLCLCLTKGGKCCPEVYKIPRDFCVQYQIKPIYETTLKAHMIE